MSIKTEEVNSTETTTESTKHFGVPHREAVSRFLVTAAATVVIIAGVKAASGLIAPILLALFLTIILLVPLRWLQKKGCPNSLSLLIVLGGTILIFLGIGFFVGKSFNDFARRIPTYKNRIVRKVEEIDKTLVEYGVVVTDLTELLTGKKEPVKDPAKDPKKSLEKNSGEDSTSFPVQPDVPTNTTIESSAIEVPTTDGQSTKAGQDKEQSAETDSNDAVHADTEAKDVEKDGVEKDGIPATTEDVEDEALSDEELQQFFSSHQQPPPSLISLDTKNIMYWISWSIGEIRHWAESGFLVLIFTIFMILEAARFPEKIDRAFGKEGPIGFSHFHHIAEEIRRYLFLKAISSLMSATAATFVYWMFGVPATLFWGIVAFVLYFIPNIGGTLAAIIPGLLIFMTYGIGGVLLYAVCLIAIECAIAYGIEPKMLGHGLGLSVVVILLSLFTWGWILGPIGLFLSAPLTIMVKIVLQAFKETEWIAVLLSDKVRENPPSNVA